MVIRIKLSNGKFATLPDDYIQLSSGHIVQRAYWEATEEVRSIVCNGCGSSGWKGSLVPDNIYGVSIKNECCWPHDWDYAVGDSWLCKFWADEVFRFNMLQSCGIGNWLLRRLRSRAAEGYFESVEHFGGNNFWAGKVRPPYARRNP